MRRILSIATILALMSSSALPLLAASCPHVKQVMSCHRAAPMPAHHCGKMHEGDSEESGSGEPSMEGIQGSRDCPMDCCAPSQRTNAVATATVLLVSPQPLTEPCLPFVPVVFTRTGFSSHTDRGPPTA
jgi:hypothetical protein